MDARQKENLIKEAYDYLDENWIYTGPFVRKIKKQLYRIVNNDPDLTKQSQIELIKIRNILSEIENDKPPFFDTKGVTFFKPKKHEITLPLEIQLDIFSRLSFEDRRALAYVSKAWNVFFNEQPIERKYLFPKKSGGLIIEAKNKSPNIIKTLLGGMKKVLQEDICTELVNGVSLECNARYEDLSTKQSEAVSAYYTSWVPLLFAFILAKYFEADKTMACLVLYFFGMPALLMAGTKELERLKKEPQRVENEVKEYFVGLKK